MQASTRDDDAADLMGALRRGRRSEVVDTMLSLSPAQRSVLRPALRRHHDLVMAACTGERASAGEWVGPLRAAHHSAAAAAHFACLPLEQAVRYALIAPPDSPDARQFPSAFFPDHLNEFAREWSARFVRNPKAWDRVVGLDAMFDWAHDGLIAPPTDDGAVLFLATRLGGTFGGGHLLRYLEARPCLINTTMAAVFDVDGIRGASLAQADQTMPTPTRRNDSYVIPQLIKRGHWERQFALDGIDRSLARGQTPYLQRWLIGLRDIVSRIHAR